jgi:histidyl-tRNA synthetase
MVLNGTLEKLGLADKTAGILRSLDKLPKIGRDAMLQEMVEKVGLTTEQAALLNGMTAEFTQPDLTTDELLNRAMRYVSGNATGETGLQRLQQLFQAVEKAGIPKERVRLDLGIARGLDYYTGTIYETFLGDLPTIGSVCSGGRYDNLAGLFTRQSLPGVGASLGLDRLLTAMEELGMLPSASTPAPVIVTVLDAARLGDYLRIGRVLRSAGIETEVYPDAKAIGKQLQYASRKGFRVALIAGTDEFAAGTWQVKDLAQGQQRSVPEAELVTVVKEVLGRS